MKKSNVVLFTVLILISAFLLWLWFYLGFNKVDSPLDLVMSIVWWVIAALLMFFIYRSEKKRREQIRTIYVSPGALFNSERGLVECPDPDRRVALMEGILTDLKYNFNKEDMPDDEDFDFTYVVRTEDFDKKDVKKDAKAQEDAADNAAATAEAVPAAGATMKMEGIDENGNPIADDQEQEVDWKGTVVKIYRDKNKDNEERPFDNKQTLLAALA